MDDTTCTISSDPIELSSSIEKNLDHVEFYSSNQDTSSYDSFCDPDLFSTSIESNLENFEACTASNKSKFLNLNVKKSNKIFSKNLSLPQTYSF